MNIAQKIQRLRLRRGWSQRALARELNGIGVSVSQRAVSGWEEGAAPRPEMMLALATLYGVPLDVLNDDTKPLPLPSLEEIKAADGKPLPEELARPLAANLQKAFFGLSEKAKNMPPGSTLGDMLLIEEVELMLNHANGLVESLQRIRSRLTGGPQKLATKKKP